MQSFGSTFRSIYVVVTFRNNVSHNTLILTFYSVIISSIQFTSRMRATKPHSRNDLCFSSFLPFFPLTFRSELSFLFCMFVSPQLLRRACSCNTETVTPTPSNAIQTVAVNRATLTLSSNLHSHRHMIVSVYLHIYMYVYGNK